MVRLVLKKKSDSYFHDSDEIIIQSHIHKTLL